LSEGVRHISYSSAALLLAVAISILSAFSVWVTIIYFYPAPALRDFTLIDMYEMIGLLLSRSSITAEILMGVAMIIYPIGIAAALANIRYRRAFPLALVLPVVSSALWLIGVRELSTVASAYYTAVSSYGPYLMIAAAVTVAVSYYLRIKYRGSDASDNTNK
jgi:hypothetical protein